MIHPLFKPIEDRLFTNDPALWKKIQKLKKAKPQDKEIKDEKNNSR